jgi:hypothetical protein
VNIGNTAPGAIAGVCELISNPEAVRTCRVFPFQMVRAYDQVGAKVAGGDGKKLMKAVSTAVDLSVGNIPEFPGKTLVVVDKSGSMAGEPSHIASIFAAATLKRNDNADLMLFADDAAFVVPDTVGKSVIALAHEIQRNSICGGTNFSAIFQKARDIRYDRVIIFSDEQGWVNRGAEGVRESFSNYCKRHSHRPFVYSFDLKGSGTSQFPEERVALLYGFSVKVFDVMKALETDRSALISAIDQIDLFRPPTAAKKEEESDAGSKE